MSTLYDRFCKTFEHNTDIVRRCSSPRMLCETYVYDMYVQPLVSMCVCVGSQGEMKCRLKHCTRYKTNKWQNYHYRSMVSKGFSGQWNFKGTDFVKDILRKPTSQGTWFQKPFKNSFRLLWYSFRAVLIFANEPKKISRCVPRALFFVFLDPLGLQSTKYDGWSRYRSYNDMALVWFCIDVGSLLRVFCSSDVLVD